MAATLCFAQLTAGYKLSKGVLDVFVGVFVDFLLEFAIEPERPPCHIMYVVLV